ncbi:acyl carrier protein Ecym_7017 [Eremothecium cymbalariae DBVPG|uniref:Acyl carrier protein n=1 Tax=Eremothecium cymbalariae (strain CBS 270.75 / DBVPG 7215 / KCTC 17166 / NRRL Y-17582) TaxID=931890 RepID=G8JVK9_ERECY|nr:hypothetical protein Ecym_7017 [Eremothecium cymbalariae DBVPG\
MFRSIIRIAPQAANSTITRRAIPAYTNFLRFYSSSLNKDEITTRVIDVIKSFDKTAASANITLDTVFSKDLGLDSLDTVELLVAVEEEFDVEIPDKVADEIQSVGDAVNYIASNPESN